LEKPTIMQIGRDSGEWLKNGAIISDAQNASSAETSAYAAGHNLPRVQKTLRTRIANALNHGPEKIAANRSE
jgi:hypothetical protein